MEKSSPFDSSHFRDTPASLTRWVVGVRDADTQQPGASPTSNFVRPLYPRLFESGKD
ncbi:MAG: hypothetical protein PVF83_11580 [Anaerolineales bacterium]